MESHRFDTLSKLLARRLTRRTALQGTGGGLAAAASGGAIASSHARAQAATPAAGTPVPATTAHPEALESDKRTFLFTQTFEGGTWQPKAGAIDTYTLTLSPAASETVYFSDRPERIVGLSPMQLFLDGLGFSPAHPPNAALVAAPQGGGDQDVLVIELFNPRYDADAKTLTYDAKILKDYDGEGIASLALEQTDNDFAGQFGAGGLFIDGCSDGCGNCHLYGSDALVGGICNVGCCYHFPDCDHCVGDGKTAYYGKLCNEAYPNVCTISDNNGTEEFACYASDIHCYSGNPNHCSHC